jgi:hypothetical protein
MSPGALEASFGPSIVTGVVGASIGALVYFAALWVFEWYGVLLSLVIGAATGAGVNAGAGGRGTLRHRVLAAVMTYGAMSAVHVPILLRSAEVFDGPAVATATVLAVALPVVAPFSQHNAGLLFTVITAFALAGAWLLAGRSRADGACSGPYHP